MIRSVKNPRAYETGVGMTLELPSVKTITLRADLVERLKGYADHKEDCSIHVHPGCTCGLTEVLKEMEG